MLLERFNPDTREMETITVCTDSVELHCEVDYDEPQESRYEFGWEDYEQGRD